MNLVAACAEAYLEALRALLADDAWAGATEAAGNARLAELRAQPHGRAAAPSWTSRRSTSWAGAGSTDDPARVTRAPHARRARDRVLRRARRLRRGCRARLLRRGGLDTAVGGFRGVFEAVADGRAVAGVVPIENLVNGTVRENYDLLLEFALEIRGEVVVPVRLCLAALPGETLDGIERVYSHVQALGQADAFLRTRPWTLLTTYNTAGAGKAIVERGERGAAAVLSPRAAALFGLDVLADGIEGDPDNRTRFLVIAPPEHRCPPRSPPPWTVRRRPHHAGDGDPERAGRPPPGDDCLRRPRPEYVEAGEPTGPRSALGVRLLG